MNSLDFFYYTTALSIVALVLIIGYLAHRTARILRRVEHILEDMEDTAHDIRKPVSFIMNLFGRKETRYG